MLKTTHTITRRALKVKLKVTFLPYFALLGIGFMFVEISLIHKVILIL